MTKEGEFRTELQALINKHTKENGSDTPDFVLADYLADCLKAFDTATKARTTFYGGDRERKNNFR